MGIVLVDVRFVLVLLEALFLTGDVARDVLVGVCGKALVGVLVDTLTVSGVFSFL